MSDCPTSLRFSYTGAFFIAASLVLFLSACLASESASMLPATVPVTSIPTLTFTPRPAATATPTWTPLPSLTPRPTASPTITRTPWPSATSPPTLTPTPTPYRDPLEVAAALDPANILPWDRSRAVTVLLMGVDRRPTQSGATRTDTMLLLRLNPADGAAGMLSIPRDLYVEIPGFRKGRINSAYVHGGGGLARRTVEVNFGIKVDYYLAVDFVAFTTLVDEIGGLDIEVPYAIDDPAYPDHNYGYTALYIPAGLQHMDGTTALAYARSRHGASDFERSQRQQQVLFAIRNTLVDFDKLPFLLIRAPGLYIILAESIDTDLPFEQVLGLALSAADVQHEGIRSAVIDGYYVTPATLTDGSQVLLPNYDLIGSLVSETLP